MDGSHQPWTVSLPHAWLEEVGIPTAVWGMNKAAAGQGQSGALTSGSLLSSGSISILLWEAQSSALGPCVEFAIFPLRPRSPASGEGSLCDGSRAGCLRAMSLCPACSRSMSFPERQRDQPRTEAHWARRT